MVAVIARLLGGLPWLKLLAAGTVALVAWLGYQHVNGLVDQIADLQVRLVAEQARTQTAEAAVEDLGARIDRMKTVQEAVNAAAVARDQTLRQIREDLRHVPSTAACAGSPAVGLYLDRLRERQAR